MNLKPKSGTKKFNLLMLELQGNIALDILKEQRILIFILENSLQILKNSIKTNQFSFIAEQEEEVDLLQINLQKWDLRKYTTLKVELLDGFKKLIMVKNLILSLSMILIVTGCKNTSKTESSNNMVLANEKLAPHPGKKLMETNCYVCHNPTTEHSDRIAPPMIAVKTHYKSENTTKEQFISDIQNWIKKPSEEKSKMPGAIRNYGLMPYTAYPEKTVEQIADYMYDYDIEQPDWFQDHFNEERGRGKGMGRGQGKGMGQGQGMRHGQMANSNINYEDVGLEYALSTKAQLGKNLMGTIKKKGTTEAVTFCNERAYFLTDSMAKVHNANIKRVSDKPRNQNNKANDTELAHIETFKKIVADQQEVEAIVEEQENKVNFYYPITTNSMCLQCHGSLNKELKPNTYKTIKGLYPNDKAIGYDVNQVRGIWSISFDK